jgi:Na+-driven multidrug efflux pump
MSYQEKRTIATLFSGLLVFAAYIFFVWKKSQGGMVNLGSDLKFWAGAILVFIGIGIVATIIIQIIFHIFYVAVNTVKNNDPDLPEADDEMDKLISMKSTNNSYYVVGAGFILALVTLLLQKPPAVMLNIIFLSFQLGMFFEGFSQIYFYRRGVHRG